MLAGSVRSTPTCAGGVDAPLAARPPRRGGVVAPARVLDHRSWRRGRTARCSTTGRGAVGCARPRSSACAPLAARPPVMAAWSLRSLLDHRSWRRGRSARCSTTGRGGVVAPLAARPPVVAAWSLRSLLDHRSLAAALVRSARAEPRPIASVMGGRGDRSGRSLLDHRSWRRGRSARCSTTGRGGVVAPLAARPPVRRQDDADADLPHRHGSRLGAGAGDRRLHDVHARADPRGGGVPARVARGAGRGRGGGVLRRRRRAAGAADHRDRPARRAVARGSGGRRHVPAHLRPVEAGSGGRGQPR